MAFHVPEQYRGKYEHHLGVSAKTGDPYGIFLVPARSTSMPRVPLKIVATDGGDPGEIPVSQGGGWEHVSVSTPIRVPTWEEMCFVKDLFWDPEDVVVQFHPRKSEYVNHAPNCLHLWRCTYSEFPTPPTITVGRR